MGTGKSTFGPGLFDFLEELEKNNRRAWFEAHKARYEELVREPARAFIRNMRPRIAQVTEHLVADDRKVGGSLMRVHRDTRFSRDARPYKTNLGIQFRHAAGKDVHAPGLYLHVEPSGSFVGVGMWHPDGAALRSIREAIDAQSDAWVRASRRRRFAKRFDLSGDSLRTAPRGYAKDHPLVEDLRRKDFIAIAPISPEEVIAPKLEEHVQRALADAAPFMAFLCRAIGEPF